MQLRKEAKRKPEKIQAYRDSNPDFCKIWVRAREYRKRVIAVVVSFLFRYRNPQQLLWTTIIHDDSSVKEKWVGGT